MIRLLLTGLFAYTAYRVTMRIVEEVPNDVAPLDMPGDGRRTSQVKPKRRYS